MSDPGWHLDAESLSATARLARAIEIGSGFQLLVMVAQTPRGAGLALEYLDSLVPASARPIGRVTAEPRQHEDADAFAAEVGAALAAGDATDAGKSRPLVLDASFALDTEGPAWARLFHRLNESRDILVRRRTGAFVLVLAEGFDGEFARAAPDFWSVRSLVVRVKAVSLEAPELSTTSGAMEEPFPETLAGWTQALELAAPWLDGAERDRTAALLLAASKDEKADSEELREALRRCAAGEIPVPTDMRDAKIVAQTQVWLHRVAERLPGFVVEGGGFPDRLIRLWRDRIRRAPGLIEPQRELVQALLWGAETREREGVLNAVLQLASEALSLAEGISVISGALADLQWERNAADRLSLAHQNRGAPILAEAASMKAVEVSERIQRLPTAGTEDRTALILSLREQAEAAGLLDRHEEAIRLAKRAVDLARLSEPGAEPAEVLSGSLSYLGTVELFADRHGEALTHLREAVSLHPPPATPDVDRSLSIVLGRLVKGLLAIGELNEAEASATRSLELMRNAVAATPGAPPLWVHDLAYSELRLAEVLARRGQLDRASGVLGRARAAGRARREELRTVALVVRARGSAGALRHHRRRPPKAPQGPPLRRTALLRRRRMDAGHDRRSNGLQLRTVTRARPGWPRPDRIAVSRGTKRFPAT